MKLLLFMLKNEDIMINGKYENGVVKFKSLSDSNDYFSIGEIEEIKENYINVFEEEENIIDLLICKIKADDKLLDKIQAKESNKLLFLYEFEEEEA